MEETTTLKEMLSHAGNVACLPQECLNGPGHTALLSYCRVLTDTALGNEGQRGPFGDGSRTRMPWQEDNP